MSTVERIDSRIARRGLHGVAATRRLEAEALAGVAPFTLMSRAGDAVARLALALVPHARRVLVFAGPGNNGGDGIEAASRLHEAGKAASVLLHGDAGRLPADAARALARARDLGVPVRTDSTRDDHETRPLAGDLAIDALLGIGATRAPDGPIADAVDRIARLAADGAHVLAVDVPTGLDSERGVRAGRAVVAHDTLALLTLKTGLFTAEGRDHAGRVWLAPLMAGGGDSAPPDAWLVGSGDAGVASELRLHAEHKGSFGDVAVVGGAPGMAGAAWLAARAAHAAGAGRVFLDLLSNEAMASGDVDPLRPELMLRRGWWRGDPAALARATVVCGCGGGDAVRSALPRLLSTAPRLVLDADALNAVAADASLQALLTARAARGLASVLTPHPLEAARLLACDSAAAVQADRVSAACTLAERFGAVLVLKGSGTVIAAPGERARICATGNAALASAGSGDVLAGWIGGRWRPAGDPAFDVATRAVIEHGAAAEPARPGALRAGDLVEALHRRSRR